MAVRKTQARVGWQSLAPIGHDLMGATLNRLLLVGVGKAPTNEFVGGTRPSRHSRQSTGTKEV